MTRAALSAALLTTALAFNPLSANAQDAAAGEKRSPSAKPMSRRRRGQKRRRTDLLVLSVVNPERWRDLSIPTPSGTPTSRTSAARHLLKGSQGGDAR